MAFLLIIWTSCIRINQKINIKFWHSFDNLKLVNLCSILHSQFNIWHFISKSPKTPCSCQRKYCFKGFDLSLFEWKALFVNKLGNFLFYQPNNYASCSFIRTWLKTLVWIDSVWRMIRRWWVYNQNWLIWIYLRYWWTKSNEWHRKCGWGERPQWVRWHETSLHIGNSWRTNPIKRRWFEGASVHNWNSTTSRWYITLKLYSFLYWMAILSKCEFCFFCFYFVSLRQQIWILRKSWDSRAPNSKCCAGA